MENETKIEIAPGDTFPFTNYTSAPFIGKWDGIEYTFPPLSTVKMLGMIPTASPNDIQAIRKKFATDLATAIFYQSDKFKVMDLSVQDSQAGKVPALYTDKDLASHVQRCLEPLPIAKAETSEKKVEEIHTTSQVLDGKESLVGQGTVVA